MRRTWFSEVAEFNPGIVDSGIEHLTLAFKECGGRGVQGGSGRGSRASAAHTQSRPSLQQVSPVDLLRSRWPARQAGNKCASTAAYHCLRLMAPPNAPSLLPHPPPTPLSLPPQPGPLRGPPDGARLQRRAVLRRHQLLGARPAHPGQRQRGAGLQERLHHRRGWGAPLPVNQSINQLHFSPRAAGARAARVAEPLGAGCPSSSGLPAALGLLLPVASCAGAVCSPSAV